MTKGSSMCLSWPNTVSVSVCVCVCVCVCGVHGPAICGRVRDDDDDDDADDDDDYYYDYY